MDFLIFSGNKNFVRLFHRNLCFIWNDCMLVEHQQTTAQLDAIPYSEYAVTFIDATDESFDHLNWYKSQLATHSVAPVIFITKERNEAFAKKILAAGAKAVLAKSSLTKKKILNAVNEVTLSPDSTIELDGDVYIDDDRKPALPGYQVQDQISDNPLSWAVVKRDINSSGEAFVFRYFSKPSQATEVKALFVKLKSFQHPSFVHLLDADLLPGSIGQIFMVQKRQDLLLSKIVPGSLSASVLLQHFLKLLEGLDKLHELGFVCGFLHPDFILIDEDGRMVISLAPNLAYKDTGKCRYASPEKRRGEKLDKRDDYYSLAAVFHYFICGQEPDAGIDVKYSGAYSSMEKIIEGALVGVKEKRYASAHELQRFIEIKCGDLVA